jgi:hypothetical protein
VCTARLCHANSLSLSHIHTHIHTYIHTYIHTHTHTGLQVWLYCVHRGSCEVRAVAGESRSASALLILTPQIWQAKTFQIKEQKDRQSRLTFVQLISSPSHNNGTSNPNIFKNFRAFKNWKILHSCCTQKLRGKLHDRAITCVCFQNDITVHMWKKWHVPSAYYILQRAYCWLKVQCKGNAIPVQARADPDDSRRMRLQDFMKIGTWRR